MIINLFVKYIPGSEFLNLTILGFAEIFANLTVGLIFQKVGIKVTFLIGYGISIAGGACLIFQNKFATNNLLVATFVLIAKLGASMCMCTCQLSTPWVFPITLCGTAFGICNLFGRFSQATGPIIAELAIPLPMEIFCGFAAVAMILCLFIKQSQE